MATLSQHVYAVKNLLNNGVPSDDSRLSNRLITHFLKMSRSVLVKQKLDKYHTLSENNYITLCLPLELSQYNECKCGPADVNCKILKATCKLPKEINSNKRTSIQVQYIDGSIMDKTNITTNKLTKYSITQCNPNPGWLMNSRDLYVLNTKELPLVIVKGIWEDPEAISGFCGCNDSITEVPCYDINQDEFPIDSELVMPMYSMTLQFLQNSTTQPIDNENDSTATRLTR